MLIKPDDSRRFYTDPALHGPEAIFLPCPTKSNTVGCSGYVRRMEEIRNSQWKRSR